MTKTASKSNPSTLKGLWIGIFIALCALFPSRAIGGGGPENVALIVNADSPASKLIANHYIHGRKIPARNVIYLTGIPNRETISLDQFRDVILKPVLTQIEQRKIAVSIDYIVYSADFPTNIKIQKHSKQLLAQSKKNGGNLPAKLFFPEASINALTYFAGAVISDQPGYLLFDANTYYRLPAAKVLQRPFVGPVQKEFEDAIATIDQRPAEFQKGLKTLESLAQRNPRQAAVLYWIARFHAQSGDARQATRWLTNAIRMGWSFRAPTRSDPAFDKVKNDPVFKGIVDRMTNEPSDFLPTRGFKHAYPWAVNGMLNSEPGQGNRYFLSTVLAVTRNHGTTEKEALRQLKSAMAADATHPTGTFYFSNTKDVRNKTRKPNYQVAIDRLKRLGHSSEIITSPLPSRKNDVLGLTTGAATYNWTAKGSKFVPGAIGDNLTSYGGRMHSASQTKVSEFIRNGAAGASGTVVEPFALQVKFPHPLIHAHYAAGCSLAEAFYQSVHGPFQLLIVGDALCQPWAKRPVLKVTGVTAGEPVKGTFNLKLDASRSPVPLAGFELYVDGVMILRTKIKKRIAFDTSDISDGFHELRIVAVANNTIETTQHVILPIQVRNRGFSTELTTPRTDYLDTDTITLKASSNFGNSIELTHNTRPLAKKKGRDVTFEIPASLLGRGPVALEAISTNDTGEVVASLPLALVIEGRLSERKRQTEKKPAKKRPPAKKAKK